MWVRKYYKVEFLFGLLLGAMLRLIYSPNSTEIVRGPVRSTLSPMSYLGEMR